MKSYCIHSEIIGPWDNWSYLIEDIATRTAVVIDPCWDAPRICERLVSQQLKLSAIWITHAHLDHVNAVEELRKTYPVPVYVSGEAIRFLAEQPDIHPFGRLPADAQALAEGDIVRIGETTAKVVCTPGHSLDSVCYWLEEDLITGDTLFVDGVGRTDLNGSDIHALYHSLQRLAYELPEQLVIHPGHAYGLLATDCLANQKMTNPYFRAALAGKDAFTQYRTTH